MNFRLLILLFIVFIFLACDESVKTVISVKDEFTEVGNGTMVATIENPGNKIELKGSLELEEGKFLIYLSNPDKDTIFYQSFSRNGDFKIDEEFERMIGNWVFSYGIVGIDQTAPSGVFDFDLIYRD